MRISDWSSDVCSSDLNDTEDNFRSSITRFKTLLHEKHGALPVHPESGEIGFAFIHGNWCLDNSLPGGGWCGLDNELTLLRELDCYADFKIGRASVGQKCVSTCRSRGSRCP